MAEMIPDRMPSRGSTGEKKLFSILQRLPDDYIVYYEPIVENRYPDFVLILPDTGLLVIEVKGWYPRDIKAGDSNTILVKESRREVRRNHPVRQARDYMLSLMDQCQEHPDSQRLLHKTGEFQNKFIFPFGHFAVLSNITSEQLKNHESGDLTLIFTSDKVVSRDILESWLDESISTDKLCEIVRSFFDPFWSIKRLTESQINTIRAIIHPEIIIIPKPFIEAKGEEDNKHISLKVLDLKQENNARNIGEGHRIIYGVAGSGKTVLLIAKAKLMSSQAPESQILFLCYNVTLAAYLRNVLKNCPKINVKHFDDWAKANGVTRRRQESNESLGNRLLTVLEEGFTESRKYDAVMIDEAQDFELSWFKCVLEAMKEPNDGDLIIVGDGSQGLYPRGKVSWRKIGISAQGRTIYKKFDLDKNYRNSREIIELAAVFANKSEEDEDSIVSLQVEPEKCQRSTGFKPVLVKAETKKDECTKVLSIVKNLLDGKWFGQEIEALKPQDIGLFYPLASKWDKPLLRELINNLEELAPAVWLTDPENRQSRTRVSESSIKIQTIHSAKGLQYRAVILMWADSLPKSFADSDEETDRRLFYVGLTRPEDFLVISASGASKFITEIENSGQVIFA